MSHAEVLKADYEPERDSRYFESDQRLRAIAKKLGLDRVVQKIAPLTPAIELAPLLDDLVDFAEVAETWPRWRHDEGDKKRVFTPPFLQGFEHDGNLSITRFHIALPGGMAPQPILHVEKVLVGGADDMKTFEGPEVVWDYQTGREPMVGIVTNDEGYKMIGPDQRSQYWPGLVQSIHIAHEAFRPVGGYAE